MTPDTYVQEKEAREKEEREKEEAGKQVSRNVATRPLFFSFDMKSSICHFRLSYFHLSSDKWNWQRKRASCEDKRLC